MKKIVLLFMMVTCVVTTALSQIPNNGFETWNSMGTYNDPDQWGTLNSTTSFASVYTCTKGTPGNVGASYIKLISKTVTGLGVVPGIAATGVLNVTNMSASGFAYSSRPQDLTGAWQYMGYSSADQGYVSVMLSKWNANTNTRDTIASAWQTLAGMQMGWTAFTMPLVYISSAYPDTAVIILSASGKTPLANSYLYVDDLGFSGTAGIAEGGNRISTISVYPNPASNKLLVNFNSKARGNVKMELLDVTGKLIKEYVANENLAFTINLEGFVKGMYFLKVNGDNFTETKKVIIE